MPLDFPTIAFIGFLLSISLSIGFSMIMLVLRGQRVLRLWTASLWLGAFSLSFLALRPYMPETLSILAGNTCAAASGVLLLGGLAQHVGHRGPVYRPAVAVAVAFMACMAWFSLVQPDLGIRLGLYGLLSIVWDVWAIGLLLYRAPADIRISCRLASIAFAADALLYLLRLFLPPSLHGQQDIMQAGLPMEVTYVGGTLLALAQCFSLVLLILERQMVDLRSMARHDGLTGLANRATLKFEGGRLFGRCRSRQRPLAVLMLDLDHFKQINDTRGHAIGDEVLRHAARTLRGALAGRPGLLARYGGEEFAVVLPDTSLAQALACGETLRATLAAQPAIVETARILVTLSIGAASATPADTSLDAVLARADAALYKAKADGRNRVVGADPPPDELRASRHVVKGA